MPPSYPGGLAYRGAYIRRMPIAGAAILSGLSYAADLLSVVTNTASGTIYYLLHNSVTPLAGPGIRTAVLDLSAVGGGTLDPLDTDDVPVDWTAVTPGTYWLQMVQESMGGFSNVLVLEVEIVSGVFDPATVAGARLVWDVSDITTLWQANDGTSQVTASGQTVGSMTNRGSLGGLFTNTGSTVEPTYTESGGLKFLVFDGVNDFLRWAGVSGDIPLSGGFYIVAGIEELTPTDSKGFISVAPAAGAGYNDANGFMVDSINTGFSAVTCYGGLDNSAGIVMSDTTATSLARAVVEVEVTAATGATNAWLRVRKSGDGDVVERGTDAADVGTFPSNSSNITSQMVLGSRLDAGSPTLFANCRIYCGVMVTGSISSDDRADCRAWVASRLGF